MDYDHSNTFMAQKGYCHILPDRIVLTEDGLYELAKYRNAGLSERVSGIVVLTALTGLLCFESWRLYPKDPVFSLLFAGSALFFVLRFVRDTRYSLTHIIPRDKIRATRFVKAFPYLTRSRLIVTFEDKDGKLRKRLIPLPGWLNEGDRHTQEAITLLEKEELLPFPVVSH